MSRFLRLLTDSHFARHAGRCLAVFSSVSFTVVLAFLGTCMFSLDDLLRFLSQGWVRVLVGFHSRFSVLYCDVNTMFPLSVIKVTMEMSPMLQRQQLIENCCHCDSGWDTFLTDYLCIELTPMMHNYHKVYHINLDAQRGCWYFGGTRVSAVTEPHLFLTPITGFISNKKKTILILQQLNI